MNFPDHSSNSALLFQRALKVMPGGNTRSSLYWPPFQLFATSGTGAMIVDVDGVERIDFHNAFSTLVHGHSHPAVVKAIQDQVENLTVVGMSTESEVRLAELLCSRVESFDTIRFANSGTEAVMNALKAARGYRGRRRFAKCEGAYHGSYAPMEIGTASDPDNWGSASEPAAVPQSFGTPQGTTEDVIVLPFNDTEASLSLLDRHRTELAAVFLDLMPVRMGMISAEGSYLEAIRAFTREAGIVLVLDEVVTFRLASGGGQSLYGVEPDMTVLGKMIGGGLPVGAVAGKAEFMQVFDPRNGGPSVWQGGTFNANPVTMTAGLASMSLLDDSAFAKFEQLGCYARETISAVLDANNAEEWQVTGRGSMFRIHPNKREISNYRDYYQSPAERARVGRLMELLMDNGIYMTRMGVGSLSTAMERGHVDQFAAALDAALPLLAE